MEDFGLPGIWGLTPIAGMLGMLALLYWFLVTGRLITRSSHEREVGIYKEQRKIDNETIERLLAQNTSLLSVGSTVQAVLRHAGPEIDETTAPGGA